MWKRLRWIAIAHLKRWTMDIQVTFTIQCKLWNSKQRTCNWNTTKCNWNIEHVIEIRPNNATVVCAIAWIIVKRWISILVATGKQPQNHQCSDFKSLNIIWWSVTCLEHTKFDQDPAPTAKFFKFFIPRQETRHATCSPQPATIYAESQVASQLLIFKYEIL